FRSFHQSHHAEGSSPSASPVAPRKTPQMRPLRSEVRLLYSSSVAVELVPARDWNMRSATKFSILSPFVQPGERTSATETSNEVCPSRNSTWRLTTRPLASRTTCDLD